MKIKSDIFYWSAFSYNGVQLYKRGLGSDILKDELFLFFLGVNTGLAEESKDRGVDGGQPAKPNGPSRKTDSVSAAAFDCGPPPQLNTIKRLAKEVNGCAAGSRNHHSHKDLLP